MKYAMMINTQFFDMILSMMSIKRIIMTTEFLLTREMYSDGGSVILVQMVFTWIR